jgi:hypothetical protein
MPRYSTYKTSEFNPYLHLTNTTKNNGLRDVVGSYCKLNGINGRSHPNFVDAMHFAQQQTHFVQFRTEWMQRETTTEGQKYAGCLASWVTDCIKKNRESQKKSGVEPVLPNKRKIDSVLDDDQSEDGHKPTSDETSPTSSGMRPKQLQIIIIDPELCQRINSTTQDPLVPNPWPKTDAEQPKTDEEQASNNGNGPTDSEDPSLNLRGGFYSYSDDDSSDSFGTASSRNGAEYEETSLGNTEDNFPEEDSRPQGLPFPPIISRSLGSPPLTSSPRPPISPHQPLPPFCFAGMESANAGRRPPRASFRRFRTQSDHPLANDMWDLGHKSNVKRFITMVSGTLDELMKAVMSYVPDGRSPRQAYGLRTSYESFTMDFDEDSHPINGAVELLDDQQVLTWLNMCTFKPLVCLIVLDRTQHGSNSPVEGRNFFSPIQFIPEMNEAVLEGDSDYDESRPLKKVRYGLPRSDKGWIGAIDRIERRVARQIKARDALIELAKKHNAFGKYVFGGENGYEIGLTPDVHRQRKENLN